MSESNLKFCTEHGFQRSAGFMIDGVVGELKLTVVKCHSSRDPEIKERVIMQLPNGDLRVHDYIGVRRCHGHQIACDIWSGMNVAKSRILSFVAKILKGINQDILGKLIEKL